MIMNSLIKTNLESDFLVITIFRKEGMLMSRNNDRDYLYLVGKIINPEKDILLVNYLKMGNTNLNI